jgi:hypothetical protein
MPDDQIRVQITGTDEASPQFDSVADRVVSLGANFDALTATMAENLKAHQDLLAGTASMGAGMDAFAASLAGTSAVADTVAPSMQHAADQVHEFGDAAEHSGEKANELLRTLLEFAGIDLSLRAIKETITEAIMGFAQTERATIALGFLMHSSEKAAETVEHLKKVAVELALPFESLVHAEQRMTAFGMASEQVERAIRAAAGAAAATGNDFDSAASAIERMALAGMAGTRQLIALGLQAKDLAGVMGVSVPDMEKSFRSLTTAARTDVLVAALEKWGGAAKEVANSTSGHMQEMKDHWLFAMEAIGKTFAPVVNAFADFVTKVATGIEHFELNFEMFSFRLQARAKESIVLLGALADASTGNFTLAASEVTRSLDIENEAIQRAGNLRTAYYEKLNAAEAASAAGKTPKVHIPGEAKEDKTPQIVLSGVTEHAKATLELKRAEYEEEEKLGKISADANLARLLDLNKQELTITQVGIQGKAALESGAEKDPEKKSAIIAEAENQLQAAADKAAETNAKLKARVAEEDQKADAKRIEFLQRFWERTDEEGRRGFERELALGKRRMEEANRAAEIMANAEIAHATRVYDANKASVEDDAKNHRISQAAKVQQLKDLETQEYKSQAGSAMGELTKAQTAGPMGGPDLGAVAAAQAKIQALNDKYLAAMAKLNIESKTAMTTMQDTMVKGITSISSAFDSGFNSWIKGGKSFAASMAHSFREMADQMIMNIERAVTQMIAQAIIHKLVGTEMGMTDARTAFKNTYAAVTAIPVVGPYLAPEAAAAAFAAVAGFAEKGADMPSTGGPFPMFLHKGEKVLTADQTKNYNSGGNTVHHHYNVAYHAAAGESPGSIMANKSQLKKLMREVIRPYAPAGQAAF